MDDRRSHKRSRNDSGEQMCRDFVKGTCFRGERCKFKHPAEDNAGKAKIPFCKDFRQGVCKYRECIYVHAPVVLEDEYLRTGWVPRFVLRHCLERFNLCIQYLKENGNCNKGDICKFGHAMLGLDLAKTDFDFTKDAYHHMNIEQVSRMCGLCIDFVKDNCSKGEECKFRHCPPGAVGMGNDKASWEDVRKREGENGYIRGTRGGLLDGNLNGVMMAMGEGGGNMMGTMGMMGGGGSMMDGGNGMGGQGFNREELMMVKRDNEMLRMEVMELRKKNEGLKATNQFLLEENANMRMKEQMGGGRSKGSHYDSGLGGYSGGGSGYNGSNGGYGASSGGYGGSSGGGYSSGSGNGGGYGGGGSNSQRNSTGRGGSGGGW